MPPFPAKEVGELQIRLHNLEAQIAAAEEEWLELTASARKRLMFTNKSRRYETFSSVRFPDGNSL